MPFLTSRPCKATQTSQLNYAVTDSGSERQVARALDESHRVGAWVKNVRLDFSIPYQHQGVSHSFFPDFIATVRDATGALNNEHLVIEVKGLEREADRSKDVGAHLRR